MEHNTKGIGPLYFCPEVEHMHGKHPLPRDVRMAQYVGWIVVPMKVGAKRYDVARNEMVDVEPGLDFELIPANFASVTIHDNRTD